MRTAMLATCVTATISAACSAQSSDPSAKPIAPRADHHVTSVVDRDISVANAALVAKRIRQVGVERVLFGTDAAIGDNLPRESWAAFRRLPLTDAEFRKIAGNEAPYLR